ncbi:MAG: 3'(2'),5'-bisphosphate nucleotidase CysQ [Elusimicrobia bacterium]|nr:3'(2'),5'-bisphosphate nucleotidase CysQ [Elusimicrobiota bacterium]
MPTRQIRVPLGRLEAVLLRAGRVVKEAFQTAPPGDWRLKADRTPLTSTDLRLDAFLKAELTRLCPEAGWLSEETADDRARLDRDYVWVVDPLDGTKEFVHRIPELAVSVALVRDGTPVLGAVINPVLGQGGMASEWARPQFWGFPRRGHPVCVSRTESEAGRLAPFAPRLPGMRPVGSVAYKLLRVAAGLDRLYFSVEPKSEWDVCAGVALLEFSGKTYLRFDGKANRFNQADTRIQCGAVAGPPRAAQAFLKRFADLIERHA